MSGLPEQANESVSEKIKELGRVVGVNLHGEIDVAHRLGRLASGRTRQIIVRPRSFDKRHELYSARRRLRSPGLTPSASTTSAVASKTFISDSLTKTNQEILYRGRQLRKDGRLWSVGSDLGNFKAKLREKDTTTVIRSIDDLTRLVGDAPFRRDLPPPLSGAPAARVGKPAEERAAPAVTTSSPSTTALKRALHIRIWPRICRRAAVEKFGD